MRTPNDRWDIVSSVGWTALMVAAGRAVETHRADGLVDDPYAELLVQRADSEQPLPTHPDDRWPDPERTGDEPTAVDEFWAIMTRYQGVRSRYFDAVLLDAARAGTGQVVLLAAGLDARAFRLDWPAGTTVFEVDQDQVLAYKDDVLAAEGARARTDRRAVRVDLRDDWPGALREAGLDPSRPTAWLAEGLLPFLPPESEAQLFTRIRELSAPGSLVVAEHFGPVFAQLQHEPALARFGAAYGVEMPTLVDVSEPRPHPAQRLGEDGWTVGSDRAAEVAEGFGRPLPTMSGGTRIDSAFVVARR